MFFSEDTIVQATRALQKKVENKFFGLLSIFRFIDTDFVEPLKTYTINNRDLSNWLNDTLTLEEIAPSTGTGKHSFRFSISWDNYIKENIKTDIFLIDLLVFIYKFTDFESEPSFADLKNRFLKEFHLKEVHISMFFKKESEEHQNLSFSDELTSRAVLKEKLNMSQPTVAFETNSQLAAVAGSLKQAAFFQTLYANSDLIKCLLICNTDLNTFYPSALPIHNNSTNMAEQIIYFGAPGTGKSYGIKQRHPLITKDNSFRTTFHPDSDYSTFVGCYKPIKVKESITYEFVPQVFTEAYIAAWRGFEESKPVYLIIEEINRGNCAQIFGDLFQLLDRKEDGFSQYEIKPEKDLQNYLSDEFAGNHNDEEDSAPALDLKEYPTVISGKEIILPPNLNIIATMNTSDQSLFPIDSAFKRRWNWHYVAIKDIKEKDYHFEVNSELYKWWDFVSIVNDAIKAVTDSEDKKMGYFFVRPDKKRQESDKEATIITTELFVSKVLFYLWTDVFKDYTTDENNIFRKCVGKDENGNDKFEPITFSDFFDGIGNVNMNTLIKFLEQFSFFTNKLNDDVDEEEDEDGNTPSSSNRDYTKYSVNGSGAYGKNLLAARAVEKYIQLNPDMPVETVINNWKSLGMIVPHFFETKEEHDSRIAQGRKTRSVEIPCGDTVVYVEKDGYGNNGKVDVLIEAVNQKSEIWGITLAKAE